MHDRIIKHGTRLVVRNGRPTWLFRALPYSARRALIRYYIVKTRPAWLKQCKEMKL